MSQVLVGESGCDPADVARRVFVEGRANGEGLWHDLESLQRTAPVHYCAEADVWIATGHAETRTLLAARGARIAFAERNDRMTPGWRSHRSRTNLEAWFGHKDGAEHMRTRKALNTHFLPAAVKDLGRHLDAVVPELVHAFKATGGGNFRERIGFGLTARITDYLLALDGRDRPDFSRLITRIMKTFDFDLSEEDWREADRASDEMRAFWQARIKERIAAPVGEDLMAQIIRSGEFSEAELVVMGENIIAAASDTTANTAANGMYLLLRNPDILEQVRTDPGLASPLVDEVLRLASAAPVSGRGMVEDVEVGGVVVPAGATVLAVLGAANRDPAMFDEPHEMRLDRVNSARAIPFGHGIHICLGQWVVREALVRLYPELLRQCGTIEITGPAPEMRGLGIRHLNSLDLRVG